MPYSARTGLSERELRFEPLVKKYAGQRGLDPDLVRAMIHQESGFNPERISPKGAAGLMQLMPDTGGEIDRFDPEQNIDRGTAYLREQLDAFGDEDKALAAYNSGPKNVTRYGGIPPFPETQGYVSAIRARRDFYRRMGIPPEAAPAGPEAVSMPLSPTSAQGTSTGTLEKIPEPTPGAEITPAPPAETPIPEPLAAEEELGGLVGASVAPPEPAGLQRPPGALPGVPPRGLSPADIASRGAPPRLQPMPRGGTPTDLASRGLFSPIPPTSGHIGPHGATGAPPEQLETVIRATTRPEERRFGPHRQEMDPAEAAQAVIELEAKQGGLTVSALRDQVQGGLPPTAKVLRSIAAAIPKTTADVIGAVAMIDQAPEGQGAIRENLQPAIDRLNRLAGELSHAEDGTLYAVAEGAGGAAAFLGALSMTGGGALAAAAIGGGSVYNDLKAMGYPEAEASKRALRAFAEQAAWFSGVGKVAGALKPAETLLGKVAQRATFDAATGAGLYEITRRAHGEPFSIVDMAVQGGTFAALGAAVVAAEAAFGAMRPGAEGAARSAPVTSSEAAERIDKMRARIVDSDEAELGGYARHQDPMVRGIAEEEQARRAAKAPRRMIGGPEPAAPPPAKPSPLDPFAGNPAEPPVVPSRAAAPTRAAAEAPEVVERPVDEVAKDVNLDRLGRLKEQFRAMATPDRLQAFARHKDPIIAQAAGEVLAEKGDTGLPRAVPELGTTTALAEAAEGAGEKPIVSQETPAVAKPPTPQVPNEPGQKYVLPSFVTGGKGKAAPPAPTKLSDFRELGPTDREVGGTYPGRDVVERGQKALAEAKRTYKGKNPLELVRTGDRRLLAVEVRPARSAEIAEGQEIPHEQVQIGDLVSISYPGDREPSRAEGRVYGLGQNHVEISDVRDPGKRGGSSMPWRSSAGLAKIRRADTAVEAIFAKRDEREQRAKALVEKIVSSTKMRDYGLGLINYVWHGGAEPKRPDGRQAAILDDRIHALFRGDDEPEPLPTPVDETTLREEASSGSSAAIGEPPGQGASAEVPPGEVRTPVPGEPAAEPPANVRPALESGGPPQKRLRGARAGKGPDGAAAREGAPVQHGVGDGEGGNLAPVRDGSARTRSRTAPSGVGDYVITDADDLGFVGDKTTARRNLGTIKLAKELRERGKPATPEQQAELVKYVGWGGLKQAFDRFSNEWSEIYRELRDVLSPEEWSAAHSSILAAHYTSIPIVRAMWDAVRRLGFNGGRVLEPAMGIGHFFGAQPSDLAARTRRVGVEKDTITALHAKLLYQGSTVFEGAFENQQLPDDFFDLVIGNPPFVEMEVDDKKFRKHHFYVHDYFFAKSLDKVRPGGVVAFITSAGTLNSSKSARARQYLAQRAKLLGAVRLPGSAFSKVANTEVTTDILFLQKLQPGEQGNGMEWVGTEMLDLPGGPVPNNVYFQAHPENVLGTYADDKLYPGSRLGVVDDGRDLPAAIREALTRTLPEGVIQEQAPAKGEEVAVAEKPTRPDLPEGSFVVDGGALYLNAPGKLEPFQAEVAADVDRIRRMTVIRDLRAKVLAEQRASDDPKAGKQAQALLNKAYDDFVKKHGFLNDRPNARAFAEDPRAETVLGLENPAPTGAGYVKSAIFSKKVQGPLKNQRRADTPKDALFMVLNEKGAVDIQRIAALVKKPVEAVAEDLRGMIFRKPDGGFELAEIYLSGPVRTKLRAAQAAAAIDPTFADNVEALEKVQPVEEEIDQVPLALGATWVPPEVYGAFIDSLYRLPEGSTQVRYTDVVALWDLRIPERAKGMEIARTTYGTERAPLHELLASGFNAVLPTVFDTVREPDGSTRRVLNEEQTAIARERLDVIREAWKKYVLEDRPELRESLKLSYNDQHNNNAPRQVDGSHLDLPGLNPDIELFPHQRNGIWRTLTSSNGMLAHTVGAGKTLEIVASAMEMRRMGLRRKPMMLTKKHLAGDAATQGRWAYPDMKILLASETDFQAGNRERFLSRITDGDWDLVIISYENFEALPLSKENYTAFVQAKIDELQEALDDMRGEAGRARSGRKKDPTEREVVKQIEKLRLTIQRRIDLEEKQKVVSFEDLGVDHLFVDEAHSFKRPGFFTRQKRVAGIDNSSSDRAVDLEMKIRWLTSINNGSGITFATGTPFTNTLGETWTMMRLLAPDMLRAQGVYQFDSFVNTFGEVTEDIELTASNRYKAKMRFRKFNGARQLSSMIREVADIITQENLRGILRETKGIELPKLKTGKMIPVTAPSSQRYVDYAQTLSKRADDFQANPRAFNAATMLLIQLDGRRAALDMRLVDPTAPDDPNSKLSKVAENVARIHKESEAEKGTQLIFIDLQTPKTGPKGKKGKKGPASEDGIQNDELTAYLEKAVAIEESAYHEVARKLVELGVERKDVAFIHDIDRFPERQRARERKRLQQRMRDGELRILIGSTGKMGEGMNVQDRGVALHHVDYPYNPAMLEQRNGRFIRQGNRNKEVGVYAYLTQGRPGTISFDGYMWDVLERKAKPIGELLEGKLTSNTIEDADAVTLSASEIKAIASGDPKVYEKAVLEKKLEKVDRMRQGHQQAQQRNRWRLKDLERALVDYTKSVEEIRQQIATRDASTPPDKGFAFDVGGLPYDDRKAAAAAVDKALKGALVRAASSPAPIVIASYRGLPVTLEGVKKLGGDLGITGEYAGRAAYVDEGGDSLIRSVESLSRGMEDRLANIERALADRTQDLADIQAALGAPFEQEAEYQGMRESLAEIYKELDVGRGAAAAGAVDQAEEDGEAGGGSEGGSSGLPWIEDRADDVEPAEGDSDDVTSSNYTGQDDPERAGPVELKAREEIVLFLSEALGMTVSASRRFRLARGVRGFFKVGPRVAILRRLSDIQAFSHELAHFLEALFFPATIRGEGMRQELTGQAFLPWSDELQPLASAGDSPLSEGFAEFVRLYVTDRNKAQDRAPRFFDRFETSVRERHPRVYEALAEARQYIQALERADPIARGIANTVYGAPDLQRLGMGRTMLQAQQAVFNDLAYLSYVAQSLHGMRGGSGKEREIPFWEEPERFMGIVNRTSRGVAESMISGAGTLDPETFKVNGESLVEAMGEAARHRKEFDQLLKARVTLERSGRDPATGTIVDQEKAKRPQPTGMSIPDARWIVKQLDQWRDNAERYSAWHDRILHFHARLAGMSPKVEARITAAVKAYAPLHVPKEAQDLLNDVVSRPGKKFGKQLRDSIRRFRGADVRRLSPTETSLRLAYSLVDLGMRNFATNKLFDVIEASPGGGAFMVDAALTMRPTTVKIEELQRILDEAGVSLVGMDDEDMVQAVTIFRPNYNLPSGEAIATARQEGKLRLKLVKDEELFKSLQRMGPVETSVFHRILSYPTRIFRAGRVASGEFLLRQAARDPITLMMQSETGISPANLGQSLARAVLEVLGGGQYYQEFVSLGGPYATLMAGDRAQVEKAWKEMLRTPLQKGVHYVLSPVDLLMMIGQTIEEIPKLAEYIRRREQNPDEHPLESIYHGRRATNDWQVKGTLFGWPGISSYVAFASAAMNSDYRIYETFKNHPFRTLMYGALLTTAALLLYLRNRQDDGYWRTPEWMRSTSYRVGTGIGDFFWPKDFQYGAMFATIPEHIAAWMDRRDPEALESVGGQLWDAFGLSLMPNLAQPFIENYANYKSYFDRPVVPPPYDERAAREQVLPYTSDLGVVMARIFEHLPGLPEGASSPAKVDNVIDYFGGNLLRSGKQVVRLLGESAGVIDTSQEPAHTLEDIPMLRAFLQTHPRQNGATTLRFYARYERVKQAYTTWRSYMREDPKKADAYRKENAAAIQEWPAILATQRRMGNHRAQMNAALESQKLSPQAKLVERDKNIEALLKTAEDYLRAKRAFGGSQQLSTE